MAQLNSGTTIAGQTAWHAGNDGTGSGLDADLLDGKHGSEYLPLAGDSTITGVLTVQTTTDDAEIIVNAADTGSEELALVRFERRGVVRWIVGKSQKAETGSDSGSDFLVSRYTDAGGFIDSPVIIDRASGVAAFVSTPTAPTPSTPTYNTELATTEFVRRQWRTDSVEPDGTDWDTLITPGIHSRLLRGVTDHVNGPPVNIYFHLHVFAFGTGGNVTQVAYPYHAGDTQGIWIRTRYSGVWAAWNEMVSSGSSTFATKANLASPALTGTPTAPTASAGTSTTQLATTAFVHTGYLPLAGGTLTGTLTIQAAGNAVTLTGANAKLLFKGDSQYFGFLIQRADATRRYVMESNNTQDATGADQLTFTTYSADGETSREAFYVSYDSAQSSAQFHVPGRLVTANQPHWNTLPLATESYAVNRITKEFSYAGVLPASLTGAQRIYVEDGWTIVSVRASVGTAPVGQSILIDVNKNGATIFSTQGNRPTIAAGTNTDVSGTPNVTALSSGDYLTVDIDQVGGSTAGSDLVVSVLLEK